MLEFGGYHPGVVVTTSAIPKFYSNGLDLKHAISTEGFFSNVLYTMFARFLT
jgi:Delta3-Delta2-enoyl-CoA isomerase